MIEPLTFELEVIYENDKRETVVVDQRDGAAWEMDPAMGRFGAWLQCISGGPTSRPYLAYRWAAWHALVRQKRTQQGWPKWSSEVVHVEPTDPPESADPGDPTAADGSSSE